MVHLHHRRLLGLAGDAGAYIALTAALGLVILASYVVQGLLVAHVLSLVFTGHRLAQAGPLNRTAPWLENLANVSRRRN